MANDYYTAPTDKTPLTTIRSTVRNNDAAAVEAGFDLMPSELDIKRSQYGDDVSVSAALYEITIPNLAVPYYEGLEVTFQALFENTGVANISVNGQTIVQIVDTSGDDIVAGSIKVNQAVTVVYVTSPAVNFQLISTAATAQDVQDAKDAAISAEESADRAEASASFTLWNITDTFNIPSIVVGSDDKYYQTIVNSNVGNDPISSATKWEEIRFNRVYNAAQTYSIGNIVQTSDGILWRSLTGSNVNNEPSADGGVNWKFIGETAINAPTNALPAPSATDVSTTPTLTASAFSGSDIHIHSQWQIATDAGFATVVYDSGTSDDLESHTVPSASAIANELQHWFRVRYFGINGVSDWSAGTSFTTEEALASIFQTTLYTGTGAALGIVSNLDFTAKDGLVWIKDRDNIRSHQFTDTVRGATKTIFSDNTNAESTIATNLTVFNNDGFDVGTSIEVNASAQDYVAWQFLEQAGFFDIVSYVGDGIAGRTVAHNLGTTFGMAIVKDRDNANEWLVQHKELGGTKGLILNTTQAEVVSSTYWNDVDGSTLELTLGTNSRTNGSTRNYIAYLFAHNPTKGIFCGSYTGTGAAGNKVVTGFPTGWLLVKRANASSSWQIWNIKTGLTAFLQPDLTNTENVSLTLGTFDSDGFTVNSTNASHNGSGDTYSFMAIADPALF